MFKKISSALIVLFFSAFFYGQPGLGSICYDAMGFLRPLASLEKQKGSARTQKFCEITLTDGRKITANSEFLSADSLYIRFHTQENLEVGSAHLRLLPANDIGIADIRVNPGLRNQSFSYMILDAVFSGLKNGLLFPGISFQGKSRASLMAKNPLLAKVAKKYGFTKTPQAQNSFQKQSAIKLIMGEIDAFGRIPVFIPDLKSRKFFMEIIAENPKDYGIFRIVEAQPASGEELEIYASYELYASNPQLAGALQNPHYAEIKYAATITPKKEIDAYHAWKTRIIPTVNDTFVHSILKSGTQINALQAERIRRTVEFFWEHGGWVSRDDIADLFNVSGPTIARWGILDVIDFRKFRAACRHIQQPIPLYFPYARQKKRLLSIVGIIQSLHWRASLREIAAQLPSMAQRPRPSTHQVFTNCSTEGDLELFMGDVNYNLSLVGMIPLDVYLDHRTKEAHDAYIAVLEDLGGRTMAVETANKLGISERQAIDLDAALKARYGKKLEMLNRMQRERGRIILIGRIPERTKIVQDEIILAMNAHGGVGAPSQISRWAVGTEISSVQRTLKGMDFGAINEIRRQQGIFPLIVLPERASGYEIRHALGISRLPAPQLKDGMELYSDKFGAVGRDTYRRFTLPFAYAIAHKGINVPEEIRSKRGRAMADTWCNYVFESVLMLILDYAEEKGLHQLSAQSYAASQVGQIQYEALINYLKFATPRALNACRYELADVDVRRISPTFNATGPIIKIRQEEHLALFLRTLEDMTNKLLKEMERWQRIREKQLEQVVYSSI